MRNYFTLLRKSFEMELSSELAYKWNFIIKSVALVLLSIVTPLVTLLIYSNTSGIPGWGFEEFILFQGTIILVLGVGRFCMLEFPARVIQNIRKGEFEKFLTKPFDPLLYLTFSSVQIEGLAEIATGLALVAWSFIKLNLSIISIGFLLYIFLIILAILFVYSFMILISALAFLFVDSWALFDLFFRFTDLARYPTSVYGAGVRFFITFIFPLAILGNYPAEALTKGISLGLILEIIIPVIIFFIISLFLWKWAMKKYTSAGG
ncbi:MAG: ABC-2 family transporter protein [Candidatus Nanoarchaeia archaeon]|nr:ABC-2 family transporter protein [Candidatus Nanoarchaeia archaeon]